MPLSRGLTAALAFCLWVPVCAETADVPSRPEDDAAAQASDDCGKCPTAADAAKEGGPGSTPGAASGSAATDACKPCAAGAFGPSAKTRGAAGAKGTTAPPPTAAASAGALTGVAAAARTAGGLGQTFDGGRGGEAGATGAVSYVPTVVAPAGAAQSAETRFSAAFNARMASVLSAYPAGRETLDRQRAADGTLKLPPVVLEDRAGSVLGVFDRYSPTPTMKLDSKNMAAAALATVASEGERAVLQRQWRDPSKLAGYLADHPDALAAVAAQYDTVFVHELTHGWQALRDRPVDTTVDRGPYGVPREPIEWEIESFREEMRYYHQKLMKEPSALNDRSSIGAYQALLTGYDGFRAYVTSLYSYIAQGSFPKIEAAQAKRKNAAAVADMQANESAYAQRENDFIRNELPAIERDGTARVIDLYESSGRPDKALAVLASAPDALRAARGPQALQATVAYLKSPRPAPIEARLDAWQAYISYLQTTTHSNVMSDDMYRVYRRDYIDAYNAKMAEAKSATSPAKRISALTWAKGYLGFLPPEDQARLRKGLAPTL